jgi:hypothetical protein
MTKRNCLLAALLGLNFFLAFLLPAASGQERTGSPVFGVDVILENKSDGEKAGAKTDKDGNFSVSGLKAGVYKLRMSCNGCRYEGQNEEKSDYQENKYLFNVSVEGPEGHKFRKTVGLEKMRSGVEYSIRIVEGSNGEIKGKVTGAWDKPKKIKSPAIKPPT